VSIAGLAPADWQDIERAIEATAAEQEGQRNTRVFTFARRLKAVASLRDRSGPELQGLARLWWERSLPAIRTKDFLDTYGDFLRAWCAVRVAANEAFMDTIIKTARAAPITTGHGDEMDILAAMCRELQRAVGDNPFFLSVRDAGSPFGKGDDPTWGSRRLKVLEAEGWLRCVERGTPQTQRASRWRFHDARGEGGGQR